MNRRWTENTAAYDEFLRGRRLQIGFPTVEKIHATGKHLERAIELDPQFGRAYARLAVHWILIGNFQMGPTAEAYRNAKLFAAKAIDLDGELWEAYWALGWAEFAGDFAWSEAERNFRKVIELAPGEWAGYHSLGYVLGVLGRSEEGLRAARIAIDVDPLAFFPRHGLEVLLTRQRRYDEAIPIILEQAEIFDWQPEMRVNMAWQLAHLGRTEEARLQLSKIEAPESKDASVQLGIAAVYAMLGESDQALEIVERWDQKHLRSEDLFYAGALAFVHAVLGDRELAMQELLETRERREMWLMFLEYKPGNSGGFMKENFTVGLIFRAFGQESIPKPQC